MRAVMGCPTATQHMCPAVISRPLSSRAPGLLSSWLGTKAVPSQPRRRHFGFYTLARSKARGRRAIATAMKSSAPLRIEIIEGSQLQNRPDSTNNVVLYTHMLCPYAQTALLTLLCKGVPHQVVHIDLSQKPAWFTQLCHHEGFAATVPVIDCNGKAQTESIDICRWVCDNFQAPEFPMLTFSSPQDKNQIDLLIQQRPGFVSAGMDLLAGATGRHWQIGTKQSQQQWEAFEQHLTVFQDAIKRSGGPYLMGSEVSLADLLYFPFMERFALSMPEFTGFDPCDACDGIMSDWLEAMGHLTCCQLASADDKLFQQALR
ncbi:hypothetical protein ABBQ32_007549 [Trebouxia sp. C0010 RCD-2024]